MPSTSPLLSRQASIAAVTVCLVHGVFLWAMGHWLWSREHYQFFPLILVASGVLAWYRLQNAKWPSRPQLSIRVMAYSCLALALFAVASYANSHWMGTLAAIWMLWTAVWWTGGRSVARRLRGPVFFLLLAVPLPLNLDLQLIIELQKLASAAASALLDWKNIPHSVSGVSIRTSLKEFMVEEACSGIHSLFSCVTAMAFWAVVFRYGPIRLLLTIIQTIGWVLVANSVRVFLIVFCLHRWNLNLESGLAHEVLGIATYSAALLLALSTDQMLRFVLPLNFDPFDLEEPKVGRYGFYGGQDATDSPFVDSVRSLRSTANRFLNKPRLTGRAARILPIAFVVICYLPFSGYAVLGSLRSDADSADAAGNFSAPITDLVSEQLLPDQVGPWKQTSVRSVTRSPDDPLGTNSVIWTFEGNGLQVEFSVDGFYPEWHDLSYCYSAMGWKLEDARNIQAGDPAQVLTRLQMYRDSGEVATSYFSCFDSQTQIVEPQEASGSTVRNLLNRLRSGSLLPQTTQRITPPVLQVQLMTSRHLQIMEHEHLLLMDLFSQLRSIVVSSLQAEETKPVL